MFISSYTTIYFFVKKFIFSNIYNSMNMIFECPYIFFGWERGHQLSTYATGGGMGRVIQNAHKCVHRGGWCHVSCVCTHLHYLVSCFWQHFCLIVSYFICRNLTYLYSKKKCSSETVIFLQEDQFLSSWIKLFLLKIIFANQS